MEARRHREQPRSGDREKAKAYLGLTRISADQRKSEIAPLIKTDDPDRGNGHGKARYEQAASKRNSQTVKPCLRIRYRSFLNPLLFLYIPGTSFIN
jgi:hypothetical protein